MGRAFSEFMLPLVLVGCIATMILPVPGALMDFLIVGNLLLAVVLLLSTLSITEALKLSSLPTILLLSTLFRLALNIATTRLILGSGDAGNVVEAFGKVVIQGNLVVGAVIFLIITLVQFMVVAKGAERVAEVSARFTLDALPGKQMSIDADVRAGLLDSDTARKKRQELQVESRFYGALDGAMKFVKGDSIAGIIIAGINIVGGLAIGVLMLDFELGDAIQKYSLLTVGDGLVSQIPALLNAISAGIVVTRVSRGDDSSLAKELFSQLGQSRAAKTIGIALSVLLASIPGMPSLPFLSLGFLLGLSIILERPLPQQAVLESSFTPRTAPLLTLELSPDLMQQFQQAPNLLELIERWREEVHGITGLILPRPNFELLKGSEGLLGITLRGISASQVQLSEKRDPLTVLAEVSKFIKANTTEFLDDIMTRRLLDQFEQDAPELVASVIPNIMSVTQITEILRMLAEEQITIRHFDLIMQAIAEKASKSSTERQVLEDVRVMLRRVISSKFAEQNVISGYVLDPVIDLSFLRAEREDKPIESGYVKLLDSATKGLDAPIIVCSKGARRLIHECLSIRGISLTVIAHEELSSEVRFNRLGVIEIPIQSEDNLKVAA